MNIHPRYYLLAAVLLAIAVGFSQFKAKPSVNTGAGLESVQLNDAPTATNYESRNAADKPVHNPAIPEEAWKHYEDAKDAVYQMDYDRAEHDLKAAVRIMPDFTEAWYNLGAAQANHAIDMIRRHRSESDAIKMFQSAVNSKKKARELMMHGTWYVYEGQEREQVRYDVEQALKDADEVLADESHLIDAMRWWAGRQN